MRPCPKCGQGAPTGARFCPACGSALDQGAAPAELRKVVTVVFCDVSGSTRLGEQLDPESVRRVVTRFFDGMKAALERHGGTVEKFIGDAVMAVFGVPVVHEDDALRAVRAVGEMRTALDEMNEQLEQRFGVRLRVRTGVNTGEVVAGDPSAGHGFVTGDAVNVAARLEQAAPEDEVLLGDATAQLVRDHAELEPAGELTLKGRGEPVRAFRLAGVKQAGSASAGDAPLVGRERELGALREACRRSAGRGSGELVALLGGAGLGKSRLVAELASSLDGDAMVITGHCLSYGEGLTYWPVREVVEALAGIDDGDSLDDARGALERLLPAGAERDTIVERLAGAVGLSEQPAAPAEIAWAVRRVVEAAAAERGPLVLVFEDAHWGEDSFLDLVEYLARTVEAPVLLLLAARDDLLEAWPELSGTRVELAPLSEAESRELVGHLAGDDADPELAERALRAGEGNPLFVEELVRALGERPGESVPPTIHALLAARIEALGPDERAVAEAASVVGRSFGPEAAFGLVEDTGPERLADGLRGLEGRGLVQPDGGRFAGEPTFSFKHSLIRDVAYQGILKAARADLHERFAGWLERTTGERAVEYEEILGHHLERACAYLEELGPLDERGRELAERAGARLGASGRRALAREDVGPAVKLLERALALTPDDDPARRDLSLKLGIALAEAGELSRAGALLDDRLRDERRGRAFLVFSEPGGRRQVIDLSGPATTVGRQEDSHVRLGWDSEVSRRHAELRPAEDGWLVVDEWSRNGSYLNGERVEGERPLRDGDVLRFGDTIVQFQAPAAAPHNAPSLDPAQATIQGKMPSDLGGRG